MVNVSYYQFAIAGSWFFLIRTSPMTGSTKWKRPGPTEPFPLVQVSSATSGRAFGGRQWAVQGGCEACRRLLSSAQAQSGKNRYRLCLTFQFLLSCLLSLLHKNNFGCFSYTRFTFFVVGSQGELGCVKNTFLLFLQLAVLCSLLL